MTSSVCAVFDIDDTLYLERDYVRSGFDAVGRWAAHWLEIPDFAQRCWMRFEEGSRGSIFDSALLECGGSPTTELISTLVEVYRTHIPSIVLEEDAAGALDAIRESIAIAVVSDGPMASQSRKAEKLGLRAFADPIILTGSLGATYRKPHPKAFEMVSACRPAGRYIYFADNPLKDFDGPKSLGWITVRVRRRGGLHYHVDNPNVKPDYEICDCSRIPQMIDHLLNQPR